MLQLAPQAKESVLTHLIPTLPKRSGRRAKKWSENLFALARTGLRERSSVGQNACLSHRRLRIRVPSLPPFFCGEDFGEVQKVSGIRIRCHACPKSSSRS